MMQHFLYLLKHQQFRIQQHSIYHFSSSYYCYLSRVLPSFSQQKHFKPIYNNPTTTITEAATIAIISNISIWAFQSLINIKGISPAYKLNSPLPKQLQKKRRFLTINPILHSINIMTSPERPIQAGSTHLIKKAYFYIQVYLQPQAQQYPANRIQAIPTKKLSTFRMQVNSDLFDFLYLFDSRLSAQSSSTEVFCSFIINLLPSTLLAQIRPQLGSSFSIGMIYQKSIIQIYSFNYKIFSKKKARLQLKQFNLIDCNKISLFMQSQDHNSKVAVFADYQQLQQAASHNQDESNPVQQMKQQAFPNLCPFDLQSQGSQKQTPENKQLEASKNKVNDLQSHPTHQTPFSQYATNPNQILEKQLKIQRSESSQKDQHQNKPQGQRSDFGDSIEGESQISKKQDIISNEAQIAREERMKKRKQKSKFKNNSNNSETSKQSNKLTQKQQDRYQSRNIEKGMFYSQGQNQLTESPLKQEKSTIKQKLDLIHQEKQIELKTQHKLPPLSIKSRYKQQPKTNESNFIYGNESSMMALDKVINQAQNTQKLDSVKEKNQNVKDNLQIAFIRIPINKTLKCILKRQKSCFQNYYYPEFSLSLQNARFIINAKKQWGHINSYYNLSCQQKQFAKESNKYAGFLQGNFSGTCFNLYQYLNKKADLIATIVYKAEISCTSTFRKFQIYVKDQKYSYEELQGSNQGNLDLRELYDFQSNVELKKIVKLVNKQPIWIQSLNSFALNFKGKGRYSSVKNMILIDKKQPNNNVLMFCKTDSNQFYMQLCNPLNMFIGFGVVLSSFDFKLLCQ